MSLCPLPVRGGAVAAKRALSRSRASVPPETPRRIRVGMPHLDAGGLSENWLYRHAGDLQWEAISRRLGVATQEILSAERERLYPMVVALRARYDVPLRGVAENDVLAWEVEVEPCGGACAFGRLVARRGATGFALELLTSFAQRQADGSMRTALPGARLAARWAPGSHPGLVAPALAALARAARRNQPLADDFSGPSLDTGAPPAGALVYEPSPYADFNGVGLLYFASYVTIAATAERQLVHRLGLAGPTDWAEQVSPLRRDIFFYGNLRLGEALRTELLAFAAEPETAPGRVKTRLRLRRERDGLPMADIVTLHARLDGPPRAWG